MKKVIAISSVLLGVVFLAGCGQKPVSQTQSTTPASVAQQPAQSVASIKSGYKSLNVSDGVIAFSFEIPEKWLTETRHSGEKQLTIEEMRDFLATNYDGDIKAKEVCENIDEVDAKTGAIKTKKFCGVPRSDYNDMSWDELEVMSAEEIKKEYFRSDSPFPTASVSAGKYIWYTDSNGFQVNFDIKSGNAENIVTEIKQEQDSYCKKEGNNMAGCGIFKPIWSKAVVDGKNVDIATEPTNNEPITKGNSGGKTYYIEIPNLNKTLVIQKQMLGDDKFENDFENLIQTLKFTK